MRKDLGAKPYQFPMPVLIVGSYDAEGKANAMNAAWGGIVDDDEIIICMSSHKTTDNIMLKKAFTVSMGTAEQVAACDYVGIVSAKDVPDKLQKSGLSPVKSKTVDAPLFQELPVALECELEKVIDGEKYLGKIKNVSVDEGVLAEDGNIDMGKFHPISFDPARHGYYALGDRLADAFKVGASLK